MPQGAGTLHVRYSVLHSDKQWNPILLKHAGAAIRRLATATLRQPSESSEPPSWPILRGRRRFARSGSFVPGKRAESLVEVGVEEMIGIVAQGLHRQCQHDR